MKILIKQILTLEMEIDLSLDRAYLDCVHVNELIKTSLIPKLSIENLTTLMNNLNKLDEKIYNTSNCDERLEKRKLHYSMKREIPNEFENVINMLNNITFHSNSLFEYAQNILIDNMYGLHTHFENNFPFHLDLTRHTTVIQQLTMISSNLDMIIGEILVYRVKTTQFTNNKRKLEDQLEYSLSKRIALPQDD